MGLYLTSVTLKGQYQDPSDFEGYISQGTELGHMLLLDTTRSRKRYVGSPIA